MGELDSIKLPSTPICPRRMEFSAFMCPGHCVQLEGSREGGGRDAIQGSRDSSPLPNRGGAFRSHNWKEPMRIIWISLSLSLWLALLSLLLAPHLFISIVSLCSSAYKAPKCAAPTQMPALAPTFTGLHRTATTMCAQFQNLGKEVWLAQLLSGDARWSNQLGVKVLEWRQVPRLR